MRKLQWGTGLVPGGLGLPRWLALAFLLPSITHAAGLNDTGITDCSNDTAVVTTGVEADNGTHPRQDCRYGRDPAEAFGMPKIGAGGKGFDFSKIANDGTVLNAAAVLGTGTKDWACTRDNVTGLIWEVKTTSGLRDRIYLYTWYNSNAATNGGSAGTASGGTCATAGHCDTEKFVIDVNAAGLCGANTWRMPTVKELESIADLGRYDPAIDPTYFPNTIGMYFWTASANVGNSGGAWGVDFYYGFAYDIYKWGTGGVRLVRAGQ